MAVGRLPGLALALAAAGLVCGCGWVDQLNASANRRYHDSRWQALAEAIALERADAALPANPRAPLSCGPGMDEAYRAIAKLQAEQRSAWQALLVQCDASVAYSSSLVAALSSRNIAAIEQLGPQLPQQQAALQQARDAWQNRGAAVNQRIAWLRAQWTSAWPEQDLNFDLPQAVTAARARLTALPSADLAAQYAAYQHNEYSRLAMVYLGYEPPEGPPAPFMITPAGAEGIAATLNRLEAALTVRFNLDEAIELDVSRVLEAQPAAADQSEIASDSAAALAIDWQALADGGRRYEQQRAAVSIARLKLLKSTDEMLTQCLDAELAEVQHQWQRLWPQNGFETNIFAFAGLSGAATAGSRPAASPAPASADQAASARQSDPLRDLSFRR